MTIIMKGTVAHLQGDLTDSGVTHSSIDSLTVSLRQMESEGEKNISVDCGRIRAADISGLQLLYVWMQCARFSGMEPELVNLPDSLQQAIREDGAGHCFTANMGHPETPDGTGAVSCLGKNLSRAAYTE